MSAAVQVDPATGLKKFNTRAAKASEKITGSGYAVLQDEKLKNPPKGFTKDHPHIELLKNKTFAVVHELDREEVFRPNFNDKIKEVYLEMLPFRRYVNNAATV